MAEQLIDLRNKSAKNIPRFYDNFPRTIVCHNINDVLAANNENSVYTGPMEFNDKNISAQLRPEDAIVHEAGTHTK